ncbi:hypothetical protein [Microcoleus sp. Pol10D4]
MIHSSELTQARMTVIIRPIFVVGISVFNRSSNSGAFSRRSPFCFRPW